MTFTKIAKRYKGRFLVDLSGVFSTAVFLTFGWSLLATFWDLPAYLLRMSVGDIVGYFAYQFMFSLVESFLVTLLVLCIAIFLPAKLTGNNLAVFGSLFIFCLGIGSTTLRFLPVLVQDLSAWFPNYDPGLLARISYGLWLYFFVVLIIFSFRLAKKKSVSCFVQSFLDRLSLLVVTYVVLSFLGIVIVVIRNT